MYLASNDLFNFSFAVIIYLVLWAGADVGVLPHGLAIALASILGILQAAAVWAYSDLARRWKSLAEIYRNEAEDLTIDEVKNKKK